MSTTAANRLVHPSRLQRKGNAARPRAPGQGVRLHLREDVKEMDVDVDGRSVHLTNLHKPFWPDLGINKRDLLQYYADVAPLLLPHLLNRATPRGAGSAAAGVK